MCRVCSVARAGPSCRARAVPIIHAGSEGRGGHHPDMAWGGAHGGMGSGLSSAAGGRAGSSSSEAASEEARAVGARRLGEQASAARARLQPVWLLGGGVERCTRTPHWGLPVGGHGGRPGAAARARGVPARCSGRASLAQPAGGAPVWRVPAPARRPGAGAPAGGAGPGAVASIGLARGAAAGTGRGGALHGCLLEVGWRVARAANGLRGWLGRVRAEERLALETLAEALGHPLTEWLTRGGRLRWATRAGPGRVPTGRGAGSPPARAAPCRA